MSKKTSVDARISLDYWVGKDEHGNLFQKMPLDPSHTEELVIGLRSDEEDADPQAPLFVGKPQIHFAGTPRALEEMGRYLIALARIETLDPDVHDHFEHVQNDDGGAVHLIVRRLPSSESGSE